MEEEEPQELHKGSFDIGIRIDSCFSVKTFFMTIKLRLIRSEYRYRKVYIITSSPELMPEEMFAVQQGEIRDMKQKQYQALNWNLGRVLLYWMIC